MAEKLSDFNLPPAVIAKILSEALPGVNVTPEARSALGKAASIFILYTTSHAHRVAGLNKRSNLSAQDIVEATHHMDFESFAPELKEVYQKNKKIKEKENEKRRERRRKKNSLLSSPAAATSSQLSVPFEAEDEDDDEDEDEDGGDKALPLAHSGMEYVTIEDSND